MDKIQRNDEEQAAFEALAAACLGSAPETFAESARAMAEGIEHFILERGYVIVAIPSIVIHDGRCTCDHHGDHYGCNESCKNGEGCDQPLIK